MMIPAAARQLAKTAFSGNQFATGGLLLMVLGGLMVQLKALPSQLWNWILYHAMMTVTITDDSQAHTWFKWWFNNQPRAKKIRHVDISTPPTSSGQRKPVIMPAPGSHWFFYNRRLFRLTVERAEEKSFGTTQRNEKVFISTFGRNRAFIDKFVQDIYQAFVTEASQSTVKLFLWEMSYWEEFPFDPRPLDSVILKKGIKESIVADIEAFKKDHPFYERTGMPYHRSYLLYGPPGTGKTSTLLGLASYFRANVHLLKLSSMSDTSLISALQNVRQNSMVILEDVDCLVGKRAEILKPKTKRGPKKWRVVNGRPKNVAPDDDSKDAKGVTLSGLLNALDGIETPSGVVFMLTTNAPLEKLDDALLRPGRIDMKVFIGPADETQKREMYLRFFPTESAAQAEIVIAQNPKADTMAAWQEVLKLRKNGVS